MAFIGAAIAQSHLVVPGDYNDPEDEDQGDYDDEDTDHYHNPADSEDDYCY